jgi:hypothetical protein
MYIIPQFTAVTPERLEDTIPMTKPIPLRMRMNVLRIRRKQIKKQHGG